MRSQLLLSCFLIFIFNFEIQKCFAQTTYILKGKIVENSTKQIIPFANIYDSTNNVFTSTDTNGIFQLNLPTNTYNFEISSVGFQTFHQTIELTQNTSIDIELKQDIRLNEVTVTAEKLSKTAEMNASGMTTLTSASVNRLPSFIGEKDIMKAVLLTPGVQSGQEGARGIFVRGGSPDQNLVLFNNASVYNVAHIYGFLSVFTTEAINKMDIYKTYIPVQYGGRLSSVLNIEPNFGNTDHWKADFSIGAITSKFHIEGPIKKDKTSMNFSIRDCHAGFFTQSIARKQYKKEAGGDGTLKYFFYDINGAIQHKVNDKNTLSWSLYAGNDFYTFGEKKAYPRPTTYYQEKNKKSLNWMNIANSIEWKTQLKKIVISNYYTLSYYRLLSKQFFGSIDRNYVRNTNDINNTQYNTTSKILENGWQTNIQHDINQQHHFNYGIKLSQRIFTVNTVNIINKDSTGQINGRDTFANPKVPALDFYTYVDYLFTWKNKIDIKTGAQLFVYHAKGKTFFYAQPRAEVIYHPISGMSIRASVMRTAQPMHLLTNNTGDIQNDVWVPATAKIVPETAWQYSGGIQYDHPKGYSASIDAYYKTMHNLSEYKFGTTFILDRISWEDQLLSSGTGKAYGIEFFFAKTKGQFTAWFKYNVGWSTRQYPELNDGLPFYYKYDRRHDVSIVLQYKLKKHFDFSIAWTYGTGWRITTPNTQYASDQTLNNYDRANEPLTGNQNFLTYWNYRNNYVLPAYHHLDIGMNYTKKAKRVTHILNVSIYNIYNNLNIFSVYRQSDVDEDGNRFRKYKQLSLFPILPSIGYTVSFENFKKKKN